MSTSQIKKQATLCTLNQLIDEVVFTIDGLYQLSLDINNNNQNNIYSKLNIYEEILENISKQTNNIKYNDFSDLDLYQNAIKIVALYYFFKQDLSETILLLKNTSIPLIESKIPH